MRLAALIAGITLLALAWGGAAAALDVKPFTRHMIVHVTVVAAAAPLLAVAVSGGGLDPTVRWPALAAPLPITVLELAVVWGWHAPVLHHAARTTLPALAAEQASFLGAGLLLWLAAIGAGAQREPGSTAAGVLALLVTSMHMTLLGALITLAPRLLYAHVTLADQRVAGMVMLFGSSAAYLAGGLVLMHGLLRGGPRHVSQR